MNFSWQVWLARSLVLLRMIAAASNCLVVCTELSVFWR